MRIDSTLTASLVAFALGASGSVAHAQFEVPPNSVCIEDSGTLEVAQGEVLQIRDSKNEAWLIELVPETKITVEGDAESDCLRPGQFVQLTGDIDKKGSLLKAVAEIEIISAKDKSLLGLFSAAAGDAGSKPLRNPGAGSFRIRGKLASYRDGELVIMAGNRKIIGEADTDFSVKVNVDDPSISQAGDDVKIKAWYYDPFKPNPTLNRPGRARAEEVTIKLAKPLTYAGKKARPPSKPAKPAGKSATRAAR